MLKYAAAPYIRFRRSRTFFNPTPVPLLSELKPQPSSAMLTTRLDSVCFAMIQLVPPPEGVSSEAVLGDARMMRLYWTVLPGTSPIVPEWQEKLWRLWLRVTG